MRDDALRREEASEWNDRTTSGAVLSDPTPGPYCELVGVEVNYKFGRLDEPHLVRAMIRKDRLPLLGVYLLV